MGEQVLDLYAEVTGQGPDVVLLHGLFGMGSNLKGIARVLSEHYRVHSLDLRNHGQSPHTEFMDYPAMAADVAGYIQHAGIKHCHVIGHSMGGKVAMQLALAKADMVGKLVIADISPVAYAANHDEVFAGLEAVDLGQITTRKQVEAILSQHLSEPAVTQFLLRNLYRDGDKQFHWRMNIAALKHNYANIKAGIDSTEVYSKPTLFIKGELSDYIQPSHREAIMALFPKAELKVIQNTGHWLHAEKPAAFNQQLLKFLKA